MHRLLNTFRIKFRLMSIRSCCSGGMALSHISRFTEAKQELQSLEKGMQVKVLNEPFDPFSSAYDACRVADGILTGVLAEMQHDHPLARDAFKKAVEAEDSLIYDEPRDWPLPARQYLGNFYLNIGDFEDAINVFNRDLQINPKNGWSLTGLKLAYQALHNITAVEKVNIELKNAWQIRDMPVEKPVFN